MPNSSSPLARSTIAYEALLILRDGGASLRELSLRLGWSGETVRRVLRLVRTSGVPVVYDGRGCRDGDGGAWVLRGGYLSDAQCAVVAASLVLPANAAKALRKGIAR